jgi:hypothetical protein
MAAMEVKIDVHFSPWLRDVLFASGELLRAVEHADEVLVTDEVKERAADLRRVFDREGE